MSKNSSPPAPEVRTGNLPGRPPYLARFRAAVRALFPRQAFVAELARRGLTPVQAARQASVSFAAVYRWVGGTSAPRADVLIRFLDTLGIDRAPYASFLAAQAPVTLVCPTCGKPRTIGRGKLQYITRRARGRQALAQRPDGAYEYPCKPCSARASGRALLTRESRRQLKARLGAKGLALQEMAEQGDSEARERLQRVKGAWLGRGESREQARQKLLRYARSPRTEADRAAIGRGSVVARATGGKGKLTQPFHLCPLCGLLIHRRGWHRICWDTWRAWYRQHIGPCRVPPKGARPSPLQAHGPKPETNLARNYRWLLERRSGGARGYARTLLASTGEALTSKGTVTEGIKAFVGRLPGSWDLVFTAPRRGNAARHALVPLPFEMIRVVGAHGRDLLIRRLIEFGMAEKEIARLTGMSLSRVRGVAAGLKPEPASPA